MHHNSATSASKKPPGSWASGTGGCGTHTGRATSQSRPASATAGSTTTPRWRCCGRTLRQELDRLRAVEAPAKWNRIEEGRTSMIDDWTYLKRELDRVEGRTFQFGTYYGWSVEQVGRVNRSYLFWCLDAVPLRAELRRTILRFLGRSTTAAPGLPVPSRSAGSCPAPSNRHICS